MRKGDDPSLPAAWRIDRFLDDYQDEKLDTLVHHKLKFDKEAAKRDAMAANFDDNYVVSLHFRTGEHRVRNRGPLSEKDRLMRCLAGGRPVAGEEREVEPERRRCQAQPAGMGGGSGGAIRLARLSCELYSVSDLKFERVVTLVSVV